VAGFELLKICFKHSQLIDLKCDFYFERCQYPTDSKDYKDPVPKLDALLKFLQDADKAKADAGLPIGLRLRSLMLPGIQEGYPKDFLIPFLRSHVPNVERFHMPCIHGPVTELDLQELEEAIAVGCPRLQHLSSGQWSIHEVDSSVSLIAALRSFLKSGCLRSYTAHRYYEKDTESGPVIKSLLSYHATTLEKIEFQECIHLNNQSILSLATTCKNLRTLRVNPGIEGSTSLRFQDVSTEWVCCDLTVLELFVDRRVVVPQGMAKVDIVTHAMERFFSQVGRLTKLEELGLGSRMDLERGGRKLFAKDLTLENGWLAELSGLKQLRHLRMYSDYWSSMVQEDIEFMDTKWPKLEKISFGCGDGYDRNVLQKDLWEGLKEMRPFIVYV
jgi:hypothetical protein